MASFKLAVGDVLDVPVKLSINNAAGKAQAFAFTLQAKRIDIDAYRAILDPDGNVTTREVLLANVTGWRGQRLVLDDEDRPADWSPEAFEAMLGAVGVEQALYVAYMRALNLADTAQGKEKN